MTTSILNLRCRGNQSEDVSHTGSVMSFSVQDGIYSTMYLQSKKLFAAKLILMFKVFFRYADYYKKKISGLGKLRPQLNVHTSFSIIISTIARISAGFAFKG